MRQWYGVFLLAVVSGTAAFGQSGGGLEIASARAGAAQVAPSTTFTGRVTVERLFGDADSARGAGGRVVFAAGARTAWHTHPLGQVLVITSGIGVVQRSGSPAQRVRSGDVVRIPAGVRHWHGASSDADMAHLAFADRVNGVSVQWMELVSDGEYEAANRTAAAPMAAASAPAPRAPAAMRELAPKLANLTDSVLFGDVWARPGLSPRDRSLITVSALIAMHRPDQLRSHLALAETNGVTRAELVEAITHLAFYAGWPSAATAVTVANEVFGGVRR
jgi:4-carboxymuconolactone decarboxylase